MDFFFLLVWNHLRNEAKMEDGKSTDPRGKAVKTGNVEEVKGEEMVAGRNPQCF